MVVRIFEHRTPDTSNVEPTSQTFNHQQAYAAITSDISSSC